MTGEGRQLTFEGRSRPGRAPGSRLVFTDAGSRIEDASGARAVEVSELGAIIWRSLDGATTLDAIAADIAEARQTAVDEELARVVEFLTTLEGHGLLVSDGGEPVGDPRSSSPPPDERDDRPGDEAGASGVDPAPAPKAYDFVMNSYAMAADPASRPTSLDLFVATLPADAVQRAVFEEMTGAIVDAVGPDRTVWGMKQEEGRVSWELYFYPHRRAPADTPESYFEKARQAFTDVVGWAAPWSIPANASLVSFEFVLDGDGVRPSAELDVYHLIEGGAAMILAYRRTHEVYRLKNTYESFALPEAREELAARLAASRYAFAGNEGIAVDHWLGEIDATRRCELAWCSYKPDADGVYLGLVDVADLADHLDRFAYPAHLRAWVRERLGDLDHLHYDLGYDYRVVDGAVQVAKTGFYGYF